MTNSHPNLNSDFVPSTIFTPMQLQTLTLTHDYACKLGENYWGTVGASE